MGFLKKSSAPSELPDLAIKSLGASAPVAPPVNHTNSNHEPSLVQGAPFQPLPVLEPIPTHPAPSPIPVATTVPVRPEKKEVAGEDYLEFSENAIPKSPAHDDIKDAINKNLLKASEGGKLSKAGFFDQVLNDINGELKDVGQLEDWYEKKFMKENVVSNMKGYWEKNKADIIIESFGSEYKRQINEKVRVLQNLEEDWREIYFKLVKKEEEMKKEERELKEVLSEFVNLCKRKRNNGEEKNSYKKI